MLAGIVFIIAGILLVVYPPLLSIIVAAFLIFVGVMVLSVARYNRRYQRHFDNPTIEFFFKYQGSSDVSSFRMNHRGSNEFDPTGGTPLVE